MPRIPDAANSIGDLLSTTPKSAQVPEPETPESKSETPEPKKGMSKEAGVPKKYQSDDEQDSKLWNVSALYLKNLRPIDRVVWFRKYGMDKTDYSSILTPKPPISHSVIPPELHLYAEYYFKDMVDMGNEKRIFLSSKEKKIKLNGDYVSEHVVDTIEFVKGYFHVNPFRDFRKYAFLMLSPNNANGINPNKGVPLFERVVKDKGSFANSPEGIDAMIDAINLVKSSSAEMIISACDKLSVSFPAMKTYGKNPSDLRYSLQNLAKTMPREVLDAIGDEKSLCKFYIKAAESEGFVRYSSTHRIWTFDDLLNDPIEPIRVSPDEEPTEVLVNYLLTNSHIYDVIIDSVNN